MQKFYTGVGSRATPEDILIEMRSIAETMSDKCYALRSGGAIGADSAFETGCRSSDNDFREIFIPWNGFNTRYESLFNIIPDNGLNIDQAIKIAKSVHPFWDNLDPPARRLHTRNVFQVLGKDLRSHSMCVICWMKVSDNPYSRSGTSTAISIAERNNIPVFNLYNESDKNKLKEIIEVI